MGIRTKLTLPLLIALLLFVGLLHLLWAPGEYAASRKAFQVRVETQFAAMESDIVRNVLTHDTAALYASLDSLLVRNGRDMSHFTLSDAEGKRIYPLYPETETGTSPRFSFPYSYPIKLEGVLLGTIDVRLDWQGQYLDTQKRIIRLEVYGLIVALALLFFTLFWQNSLIRRPIEKLQRAMQQMARGEEVLELPATGKDEIGTLTASFHILRTEILEQQEQIKAAHRELEEAFAAVAERNKALNAEVVERKKAEVDLVNSQHRLQLIFDSSPAAIFIHDLEGKILEVNKTMEDLFCVSKEDVCALSIGDDFSSPENPTEMVPIYWEKVMSGEPQTFEWISRRPHDGSTFMSQVDLRKIHYGGKEVIYATVLDISARKEMEERLASEKERLAVTLRSIGDGVITTDIRGKIVFINKVAENLSGWSNDDASGRDSREVFNIINSKTREACRSPVSRVLQLGQTVNLAEDTLLITKDGGQISIADSGAPIRDRSSDIIGVVIVFRDVSRERERDEELAKIKKLESVGVLAGGIAHDFNNLLSAILGNIEMVCCRVQKDDSAVSLLMEARKATRRAAKLTQQLLTFSRGGDPVKEKTSLNELVHESADFVLHGSRIACEYSFVEDLWVVEADSGQLGQVIQNIVLNAKHAMPRGGKIRISCYNVKDGEVACPAATNGEHFVCIEIQDSGIGIPLEIQDKVFDPYFTTKQEGSGLGLAVCHSIISKHEGHLRVRSEPGVGTTFYVCLPSGPSRREIVVVPPQRVETAVRAKLIMVMDDEEMLRKVAKAQLSMLGHGVVLVADGEQAVVKYQELQSSGTPVDLVLMDLTIPGGMGGQEAARKLLAVDPDAKIIVVSGYSTDPVMAAYDDYGFCGAISKPFDLKELAGAIAAAF